MQYLQGWHGNKEKNMANIQRMPKNCNHPSLLQHELQIVSYTCMCHWQQFQCPWPARRTDTTQHGGKGHSTQLKTNVQTGRNPTASHSPWAEARLTRRTDVFMSMQVVQRTFLDTVDQVHQLPPPMTNLVLVWGDHVHQLPPRMTNLVLVWGDHPLFLAPRGGAHLQRAGEFGWVGRESNSPVLWGAWTTTSIGS